ncbi:unnamed protein product [Linum trigynum]|uniref:Uncharacterized protein n=1 Tax=Linum trigynum TaxID=586398 RepID=A0AAV2G3Y7_9ROSI
MNLLVLNEDEQSIGVTSTNQLQRMDRQRKQGKVLGFNRGFFWQNCQRWGTACNWRPVLLGTRKQSQEGKGFVDINEQKIFYNGQGEMRDGVDLE